MERKELSIPQAASRAAKDYLATLEDASLRRDPVPQIPKFVSRSDPAAQWTNTVKTAAFFAYADNYLIDVKFGIIMDVEATRAARQAEVGASRTMIERTEATFGIKPQWLCRPTLHTGRRPISTGLSTNRRSRRTFQSSTNRSVTTAHSHGEEFIFDKDRNILVFCPANKALTTTGPAFLR